MYYIFSFVRDIIFGWPQLQPNNNFHRCLGTCNIGILFPEKKYCFDTMYHWWNMQEVLRVEKYKAALNECNHIICRPGFLTDLWKVNLFPMQNNFYSFLATWECIHCVSCTFISDWWTVLPPVMILLKNPFPLPLNTFFQLSRCPHVNNNISGTLDNKCCILSCWHSAQTSSSIMKSIYSPYPWPWHGQWQTQLHLEAWLQEEWTPWSMLTQLGIAGRGGSSGVILPVGKTFV